MLQLTLPWPPSALSPNKRYGHWAQLARAKRSYREACAWQARSQGAKALDAGRLHVDLEFVPPDRRRRDLDNLIAAMKSGLDGLADVLGVDDNRWHISARLPLPGTGVQVGGMVRVTVGVLP